MNRYRRRGAVGTIYVARLSRGLYKVGFSLESIERRAREVSAEKRTDVEVIAAFPGTYVQEVAIHDALRSHRAPVTRWSRELYRPTAEVVAFAESVAALHPANIVVRRAP